MKKRTFFFGLLSGVVLSQTWRPLTKTGIKLGIMAGHRAKEFSQQAIEDIGDMAAEAREELRAEAAREEYAARDSYEKNPEITLDQDQEIN